MPHSLHDQATRKPLFVAKLYDSHCIAVDLSNVYEYHGSFLPLLSIVLMMTVTSLLVILQRRSTVLLRCCHRAVAPRCSSIVQPLDICTPLVHVGPQHTSIVGQQAVDLSLNVGGLRPDAA